MRTLIPLSGIGALIGAGIVYASDSSTSTVPSNFVSAVVAGKSKELTKFAHPDVYFYVYNENGVGSENLPLSKIMDEVSSDCAVSDYTNGAPYPDEQGDSHYLFSLSCPAKGMKLGAMKIYLRDGLISHVIFNRRWRPAAPPPPPQSGGDVG